MTDAERIDELEQRIDDLERSLAGAVSERSEDRQIIESLNAEMGAIHAIVGLFMRAITEGRKDRANEMLDEALSGWMKLRLSLQTRGVIPPDEIPDDTAEA